MRLAPALAAATAALLPAYAPALVTLKLADTSTPMPGTAGTFASFGLPVANREFQRGFLSGSQAFFEATGSDGTKGVYHNLISTPALPITVVADTHTPAPAGGVFTDFSHATAGGGAMGFIAHDSLGGQGIYASDNDFDFNKLYLVRRSGESAEPGKTFTSFNALSVFGYGQGQSYGAVVRGMFTSNLGLYRFQYPANPEIAQSLPLTFEPIALAGVSDPSAVVLGPPSYKSDKASNDLGRQLTQQAIRVQAGTVESIYHLSVAGMTPLVDNATPAFRQFTHFGDPVASSGEIAFIARYATPEGEKEGVFTYGPFLPPLFGGPAVLEQRIASGDVAPDSGGAHFARFLAVALLESPLEFVLAELDDGRQGIYFRGRESGFGPGAPKTFKVVDTTDLLDGKQIVSLAMASEAGSPAREAPSPNGVLFRAIFADGSQGIYLGGPSIPEPCSTAALCLLYPLSRRRRN